MALVVEDGTIVSGANSYLSVADIQTFATARGLTLPATDADIEVLVYKAMDYLESYRSRYQGYKVNSDQALQWPRAGVSIDGYYVDTNEIPIELKYALAQATAEVYTTDLMPNGDGREVLEERVEGAVSVKYSQSGSSSVLPVLNKVNNWVRPLLKSHAGLKAIRV